MKKTGLTLGKFAPFHRGHQLVLETALRECDEVLCMIYDSPEVTTIPLQVRAGWIKKLHPQVEVIMCWDGPPGYGSEPHVVKEQNDYILKKLGGRKITHFYSSEFYGESVSAALGAIDRRVDEARAQVPVSGTQLRAEPYQHRHFVSPVVYADLITRVVFVGAMSTGKTTLASALAERFKTKFMPEYGREYWEKHQRDRRIDLSAFDEIATGHIEREDQLALESNRYLFVDTNAVTTYVYAQDYYGCAPEQLTELARQAPTRYDLWFLCEDDIPYDDTWDRSGPQKREWFHKMVVADLNERRIPYIHLYGTLENRISIVESVLRDFQKYHTSIRGYTVARHDMLWKRGTLHSSFGEHAWAAVFGALVGDALGVPVEFSKRAQRDADPVRDMRGYGTWSQPPGTWSDDGALILCSMEGLLHGDPTMPEDADGFSNFYAGSLGKEFVRWMTEGKWTAHGNVFDIGNATLEALTRIADGVASAEHSGCDSEADNGNGSLMRILPIALRYGTIGTPAEVAENAMRASAITHAHIRSQLACACYCLIAQQLMHNRWARTPLDAAQAHEVAVRSVREGISNFLPLLAKHPAERVNFERVVSFELETATRDSIKSGGYVIETLEASIWCLLNHPDFRETVLAAVNLGGDTDTTGCVTGGLAGLLYGWSQIPDEWQSALPQNNEIRNLVVRFGL